MLYLAYKQEELITCAGVRLISKECKMKYA